MFLHFDYLQAGFTDEEWDQMPRRDRVLVRDYQLNGGDADQTAMYAEYDTAFQVEKVEKRYNLKKRPLVYFTFADFNF